jgi:hypothetical protein
LPLADRRDDQERRDAADHYDGGKGEHQDQSANLWWQQLGPFPVPQRSDHASETRKRNTDLRHRHESLVYLQHSTSIGRLVQAASMSPPSACRTGWANRGSDRCAVGPVDDLALALLRPCQRLAGNSDSRKITRNGV